MTGEPVTTALLPVKRWALSKSRLRLAPADRTALALSFSLDVLDVLVSAPSVDQVVLISAKPELCERAVAASVQTFADRALLAPDMLNSALDIGRRWAQTRFPDEPLLVVPADLPALTVDVLEDSLARLAVHDAACIPDAAGAGTTLLWAGAPALVEFRYGPQSASRHAQSGCRLVLDGRSGPS